MTDYTKLVAALRKVSDYINCYDCDMWGLGECDTERKSCVLRNAAAAIEELQAQLPKRGEWVRVEDEESYHYECSECGERPLYSRYGDVVLSGVCPMCGAKMEVQE